jgi:hypothetical protein
MSQERVCESVHITISMANGCVIVHTSQQRPTVGNTLDPVSQLALEIGMLASRSGAEVRYQSSPVFEFISELVSPDGYGHAVTKEVRTRAAALLGVVSNKINGARHDA